MLRHSADLERSINTNSPKEFTVGKEDVVAGRAKRIKGKINEVVGAARGKPSQEFKGKIQKRVGKVQEKMGKRS